MAFSAASSLAPAERITWRTVGSAVGMAAMARAMAVMKRLSAFWPRERPRANMTIMVPRAAAPIHSVMVLSCRVSGVCSLAVAASMPAILPTSASAPLAVTIITPLPWVTGVFMNAMLVRSPGPRSASASASVVLDAGTLSPVSADSSMSSELRLDDPAVGGDVVAGGEQDDVAEDDLLGRDLGLGAVAAHARRLLHQRLEGVHRALGLALLAQAGHGVEHREGDQHQAGAPLADDERDHGGDEQDDLHVGAVLVEEPPPARLALLGGQGVGTVLLQQLGGLRRGEAARRVDAEAARRRPRPRARTSARPSPPPRRVRCQSLPSLPPRRRPRRITSTSCPSCRPSSCPSCRPCRRPSPPSRAPRPRTGRPRRRREPRPPAAPWSP